MKVDIVGGKSKDDKGVIDDQGHAWIFAYTSENTGILIDPTWGAGSVENGTFTRTPGNNTWFDIDPEWLIFTHFPDDDSYQLMQRKVTFGEFSALPSFRPELGKFGFRSGDILTRSLKGEDIDIPNCFGLQLPAISIHSIPTEGTLRVGRRYDFVVKPKRNMKLMIRNGEDVSHDWRNRDGYTVASFIPSEGNSSLMVSFNDGSSKDYNVILDYKVAPATEEDISDLEALRPDKSPTLKAIKGYRPDQLKVHNVDFPALIKTAKKQKINEFPKFYDGLNFNIHSIPWNRVLYVGEPVTFIISPLEGQDWTVVNGEDWITTWTQDAPDQPWKITVVPQHKGTLCIAARLAGEQRYRQGVEWIVK